MDGRSLLEQIGIITAILLLLVGGVLHLAPPASAATQSVNFKHEVGISGQVITNPTTATFLTVPLGAHHAWITVKDNPACFSYDAAAPTATSGGEWAPGVWRVENDRPLLQAIRFINCAEGATVVKVYYSRDRRVGD
jgi:hypothetical protein